MATTHVFWVTSPYDKITIKDASVLDSLEIKPGVEKIGLGLGYPALIIPYYKGHRVYRRKGYGAYMGSIMHEVVLIDANGNVSPETPVMFDYADVDYIDVIRADLDELKITGGNVTTVACNVDAMYIDKSGKEKDLGYYYRGMHVRRPNTLVEGVKHYVTGEFTPTEFANGKEGPCYNGFFTAEESNHVTFKNCVITGRRYYGQGTYDFSAKLVNKIVLDGCTQSNFWITVDSENNVHAAKETTPGALPGMTSITVVNNDGEEVSMKLHWGCGGTNFCKNMEYINSYVSRFDAHAGLYNGKIINSTVNYMALTGTGKMEVKNVRWFSENTMHTSNSIFHLRSDYGSTWTGEIEVDGLEAYFYSAAKMQLFYHSYSNWYFGYQACFPSISMNNVTFCDIDTRQPLNPETAVINLESNGNISKSAKLHLPESHKNSIYSVEDKDKDKYVDNPFDLDGDGVIGNSSFKYADVKANPDNGKSGDDAYQHGYTDESSFINFNPIRPPEFIKMTNCNGYKITVKITAGEEISDGGYWDDVESYGGFYGDTKFWYGTGENDYFVGTADPKVSSVANSPFVFKN
jgi:hypothetical protein